VFRCFCQLYHRLFRILPPSFPALPPILSALSQCLWLPERIHRLLTHLETLRCPYRFSSALAAFTPHPPPIDSFRNSPLPLSVFHRLSRFHTTFFSFSPPFSASPPPKFIYPAFFVPFLDYWARKWTEMMILTSFG
jgi:hypothetical protein